MKRWLVVVALVAACKKDSTPSVSQAAIPSPGAPASTAELDALWAKAPAGAIGGFVVSPRALTMLEHGWTDVHAFLKQVPQFAPAEAEMGKELAKIGLSTDFTLADFGLAPGKGFAVFFVPSGGGVMLLPVVDRAKFEAKTKDGKLECKPIDGWLACAENPALLDALGKGKLDVSAAKARGDIEGVITDPVKFAGVIQIDRGAFIARGVVSPLPDEMKMAATKLGPASKPRVDLDKSAGFAVLNLEPLFADVPPMKVFPDLDARELARSIGGPFTVTMPAGDLSVDARLPLKDTGPMKKLIAHCEEIPAPGAKRDGDHCRVPVPMYEFTIDMAVDGNELRVTTEGGGKPVSAPASALGVELAKGEWQVAFWGHGTLLAPSKLKFPEMMTQAIPDEAQLAVRVMSMMNEMGLGISVEGDSVRFVLGFRSGWANPDDVVAKIAAIPADDVLSGKAGDRGKAIAEAAPKSPFAADYAAGPSGVMIPVAVTGILAAVAIPAYLDYMKKSKRTEADIELNAIGKAAKRYYGENGSFPKGTSMTLPQFPTCCGLSSTGSGINNKCPNAVSTWRQDKVWSALEFQIDQPDTTYRYTYNSLDGTQFTATATSDLDCDGQFAMTTLHGEIENGVPVLTVRKPPVGQY
jgi:Tfp pilus assembly protein PilE